MNTETILKSATSRLSIAAERAVTFSGESAKLSVSVGRFALDASVQLVEMVRVSGVPLPKPYADRIIQAGQQRERRHHEQTAYDIACVCLEAKKMEARNQPYAIKSEIALEVLAGYCKEKNIEVTELMQAMNPLEGRVLENSLDLPVRE